MKTPEELAGEIKTWIAIGDMEGRRPAGLTDRGFGTLQERGTVLRLDRTPLRSHKEAHTRTDEDGGKPVGTVAPDRGNTHI